MNAKEMVVWIVGLLLLASVVASPVACTMRRHQAVADAIKAGADPMEAKCAIEGATEQNPQCALVAARTRK